MFLHLYFYFLQPCRSFLFTLLVYSGVAVLLVLTLYLRFLLLITSENWYPLFSFFKRRPQKKGFLEGGTVQGNYYTRYQPFFTLGRNLEPSNNLAVFNQTARGEYSFYM